MGDGKRGADLRDYYLLIAHFLAYTASFLRFASYSILFFSFLYAYYFLSLSLSFTYVHVPWRTSTTANLVGFTYNSRRRQF